MKKGYCEDCRNHIDDCACAMTAPTEPTGAREDEPKPRMTHDEIDEVRRRLMGNKVLSLHHSTLNKLLDDADVVGILQSALATARQELGYAQAETANFKACWDAACNDIADRDNRIAELEREGKDAERYRYLQSSMQIGKPPIGIRFSMGGKRLTFFEPQYLNEQIDAATSLATPPADGGGCVMVQSIVRSLSPSGAGWHCLGTPKCYDLGFESITWLHANHVSVISAVEVVSDSNDVERGPEYHISVALQTANGPERASTAVCVWVLAQFGLEGSEEDNHVPGGKVRNFWRTVSEPLIGLECPCKETEPKIVEDKGEFVWRPVP